MTLVTLGWQWRRVSGSAVVHLVPGTILRGSRTACSRLSVYDTTLDAPMALLETALRMAEALEWPKLGELIREARSDRCHRPGCQVTFLNEGGNPKRYCSQDCRKLAEQMRDNADTGALHFLHQVRTELARVHGTTGAISRKVLTQAADQYARSGSKRGRRVDAVQAQLDTARAAAAAFCNSCEPDGLCKTPECELRVLSPLPLIGDNRDVSRAVKAPGSWAPEHRERQLVALRTAAERRWTPEERQRMALASRRRWEAMTPEQRSEMGKRISSARKRVPA